MVTDITKLKRRHRTVAMAVGLALLIGCESSPTARGPEHSRDNSQSAAAKQSPVVLAVDASIQMARPDPQMKAVLDALAAMNPKPIEKLTPAEARKQPSMADAAAVVMKNQGKTAPDVDTKDRMIPGAAGEIPARVYMPKGAAGTLPIVVYFHGGGWVIADINTYDGSCRAISKMANCTVVSVGYREAPENKFPAAADDAYASTQWVMQHAADFKGDANHVAVFGESAGGNLAAVVCLMARDKGGQMPAYQVLVYPVTDAKFDTPSYMENANAKPLNKAMMEWFYGHYLNSSGDGTNPYASPLRATGDLGKLPAATVITDQIDPLRDDGKAYADKLKAGGVAVEYRNFDGVTHEFFGMGLIIDKAMEAEKFAMDGLKMGFSK